MSGLLLYGDTERSSAMRHEVPLAIIDPFLFAELDGRSIVLTSSLERDRIAAILPQAEIFDFFDLGLKELVVDGLSRDEATREVVARLLGQLEIGEATVPGSFPVALADRLRAGGITLMIDDDVVEARRRAKAGPELAGIRQAQRAAQAGMAAAAALLSRSRGSATGDLVIDGAQLLAEDVRAALRAACAEHGAPCPPDVLVSSVRSGYGHDPGSGPLPAGLPITVDLWPQHEQSACWADMTRTFVMGEPAPEHAALIAEQERLVDQAMQATIAAVRPGVTGRALYDLVCEVFEAAGYATQRTGPGPDHREGFQFALGHGVGLEVHEAPDLGLAGRAPLVSGDVIAIEPGLWDHRIGEVRFEDLLLVTDDGCENLTRYPYDLSPSARAS
jgi:Xaa-Pro aminopeptidase